MRLAPLLLLLLAAPAAALTIQMDSVALGASNTPDSANHVSQAQVLTASDSVPDVAGGPFAEVSARWAGSLFANDVDANATASWSITFTVTANPGVVYDLVVLQELAGAFTFFDDSPGLAGGSIGELTGTLEGVPHPLLTMPVGADSVANSAATASVPFQRSRLLEIPALVGTQTFTLAFTFDASATSANDQVAVQLGLPGSIAAAAYPGIGGRTASSDGHHLSLSTRVIEAVPVPEPTTLPLVLFGLLGFRRKRCR